MKLSSRFRQAGATAVEFALVIIILLLLLVGLLEFGRAIFQWNSAVEATRHGARIASIASPDEAGRALVLAAMRRSLPELQNAQITVEYSTNGVAYGPAGTCTRETTPPCAFVRVGVDVDFTFISGIWSPGDGPLSIPIPTFATTVPIEALGTT